MGFVYVSVEGRLGLSNYREISPDWTFRTCCNYGRNYRGCLDRIEYCPFYY